MRELTAVSARIEKSRIADSFAKAAETYDAYAQLQRDVADKLLSTVSLNRVPQKILDLGSGTGYCSELLSALYPDAEIVSLDIAENMLRFAKNKSQGVNENISHLCADAENLPIKAESVDLIVSSLAIQWCENYSHLFFELNRVLCAGGCLYMSTFGPDTLQELRAAWSKIDAYIHVNEFTSKNVLENHAFDSHFNRVSISEERYVNYYNSLSQLTSELKAIGAHNMNKGQGQGLSGRKKVIMLKEYFESCFIADKGIPVTYDLQYLSLEK